MWLLGKPLSEITTGDISRLIQDKIPEGLKHDYKKSLPDLETDDGKAKLLTRVSAFANKVGGTLIFGIEEEMVDGKRTGFPGNITGIGNHNQDQLTLRIQQICQSGLQPALTNLRFHFLNVGDKQILMLGIPRSLFAPHMIWFNRSGKFYSRNNGGNYQMEVHEIREAFLEADEWMQTAEQFRMERITKFQDGTGLVNIGAEKVYIIHVLPIGRHREPIDVRQHQTSLGKLLEHPARGWVMRFNIDGYIAHSFKPKWAEYAQFYRSGALEILLHLAIDTNVTPEIMGRVVNGDLLEKHTLIYIEKYVEFMKAAAIEPPVAVFITLMNVNGCSISIGPYHQPYLEKEDLEGSVFDRDIIRSEGIVLESLDTDIEVSTAPLFDMLWQASGHDKSPFVAVRAKKGGVK